MADPEPGAAAGTPAAVTTRQYRPELQGLRALAVTLVVVYHVWFGRVSGGVDVFFLVSGFLVTGQLYRAAARGTLRLRGLWARQAARLLPAAFTVLLASAVLGMLLLPEARWAQTVRELVASAFFVENWQLAADSVDYAAQNNTQSMVQHFWSLSIQVQFMVVWPLLVALVAVIAGTAVRERLRGYLLLTMAGLFVASLTFSISLTITDQPQAYFHSLTRVWEFALGGLLALTIDRIVLPAARRVLLGWLGVVALVACGALLQVDAVFPGFVALWPTLAGCLVLVAGATGSRVGVDRILSARPVTYLGDISYALYLWHWPLLVLFLVVGRREEVGLRGGLLIIGVSLVLAILTHHLIEEPVRRARIGTGARFRGAAAGLVMVLLSAGFWQVAAVQKAAHTAAAGDPTHPGALAALTGAPPLADLIPPLVTAVDDWSHVDRWDCSPLDGEPTSRICRAPRDQSVPPTHRITVVGDSHSQQLTAALLPVAEERDWEVTAILRGGCPFSTVSEIHPDDPLCRDFLAAATAAVEADRPDAVLTMATRDARVGLTEVTPPGFVERWRWLDGLGVPVVAVRDNPRYEAGVSPPDCLQLHGRGAPECGLPRAEVYGPVPPYAAVPDVPANVSFVDLADLFCGPDLCPAELGNVLVYKDDNHVSASYMASLAPVLGERMTQALGW